MAVRINIAGSTLKTGLAKADIKAVKARLDKLKVNYYLTKDNDSWSKLCNSMKAPLAVARSTGHAPHRFGATNVCNL